jgi:hypothetical protein
MRAAVCSSRTERAARCLAGVGALLIAAGCGGGAPLGAADSYLLLAPVTPPARSATAGLPVVDELDPESGDARLLTQLFASGFASEMVRTVHLAKQLVRNGTLAGKRFDERLRAAAIEPLCLVLGLEPSAPRSRGLAVARWLRSPDERAGTVWLGLPAGIARDKAAVQTVSGRLASHAVDWIAGGADPDPSELTAAYRMAMEVIAREWRVGRGPAGALSTDVGTTAQRTLFAEIRENRAALGADGKTLRPAAELLSDPQVAATVIYRLAQMRTVAQAVARPETYTPFVAGPLPEGVSGAAVLGPIRNFQAKLFTAWGQAVLSGRPPRDIADLVQAYVAVFPAERKDVLRIFLVTTYLGTVQPGGVSREPDKADQVSTQVAAVIDELAAGKRGLRDAVAVAHTDAAAPAPTPPRPRNRKPR